MGQSTAGLVAALWMWMERERQSRQEHSKAVARSAAASMQSANAGHGIARDSEGDVPSQHSHPARLYLVRQNR